jgi:hypothetical protein
MAKYSAIYSDFTIVDGTHNTTMYDLKLIPYTNVDCLGKNVISGIVLDESENSDSVKRGLELFGLHTTGGTLMSDGGSAFPLAAAELNMVHILCTQHFQQDVFASCGGMGAKADVFKRDALALIYKGFASEQRFDEAVGAALMQYGEHPSAVKCIAKIVEFKRKVCHTFTGELQFEGDAENLEIIIL